jgi:hypothetical protein
MRRYRDRIAFIMVFGIALVGLWLGRQYLPSALGYAGGGMGTSTLSFDPQRLAVQQGGAASAKVTVTLASGNTWATRFEVTDVPAGVTISFEPASGDPTFTSTMTVKATSAAQPGTYTVKVQATGDDPSVVARYQVTVSKPSSGY